MDADKVVATAADLEPGRPAPPPRGYERFYRENYATLVVAAMYAGASPHEADDATDETLHQMLDIWAEIEHPRAWARRALLRNVIDIQRREQRRRATETEYFAAVFERPGDMPGAWLDDPRTREELLGVLTGKQREIVELILRGLDPAQVAVLLGASEATVRRNLSNIRRRLDEKSRALRDPGRAVREEM